MTEQEQAGEAEEGLEAPTSNDVGKQTLTKADTEGDAEAEPEAEAEAEADPDANV